MNDQLVIFPGLLDPAEPRVGAHHREPQPTEREAAILALPRSGIDRRRVLDAIAAAGDQGVTDPEIAAETGLWLYTAAPRRHELLRGGWCENSGLERSTGRGRMAIAWRLTDAARREYDRHVKASG